MTEVLGKIAGYSKTLSDPISVEAIVDQANTFQEYVDDSWMAKFIKVQSMLKQTHPYTVLRVKEILSWSESDHYKKILSGDYRKQGEPASAKDPPAPAEPNAAQKAASAFGTSLSAGLKSFGDFGKKSE